MGWFSSELIPEDAGDWIFAVYAWLMQRRGGWQELDEQPLILPTEEFYPPTRGLTDDPLAQDLLLLTKQHAGLEDWPTTLEAHEDDPATKELLGAVPHESVDGGTGAAGTFLLDGEKGARLTYSPRMLRDPAQFVATMAHELAHYLMHSIEDPPPGGWEAEEHATDVCAGFLGFGVFAANGAVSFRQFQDGALQGWESSRQGYLSEEMLAYSLAVFLAAKDLSEKPVLPHLKTNPRSYLKRALADIRKRRRDEIAMLRSIGRARGI